MAGIVTGGTWCVDLNKIVAHWPPEDTAAEIVEIDVHGGGSGCNFALDIKALDPTVPVETIGLVGDDEHGRVLLGLCDGSGVVRDQMHISDALPTQFTDAYCVKSTGRRTHLYYPGISTLLCPDHFDLAATTGRLFHLGLPGAHKPMDSPWQDHPNGWAAVLQDAKRLGRTTSLELFFVAPERMRALVHPCLPLLDILVINDYEIAALADMPAVAGGDVDPAQVLAAARKVLGLGAMQVVAAHYPGGAIAVTRDGTVAAKGSTCIPEREIVGANGAGDAYCAGFVYGYLSGWDLDRCLALGHASAAMSLTHVSTTKGVRDWQACMAQADAWGWREMSL